MVGLCNSPEHAAEVTLQPIRRFHLDGAIVFADLPQIAAALGQFLEYRDGDGPILSPAIRSRQDVEQRLDLSRLHERLAPVYETVNRLAKLLPQEVALIGYAGAPWTVSTYMVEGRGGGPSEHAIVRQWALSDPDGFQILVDLVIEATIQYLDRQINAGAEAIQLFESWAGLLPEPFFRRWCVQPVNAIVEALRARHPSVPVIVFPRNAGLLYEGYLQATKGDCLGLDSTVPLGWAAEKIQGKLGRCVQGNLDPRLLVAGGAGMRAETERILRTLGLGPFVFNLGHGIPKDTPPDHVATLAEHVRRWKPS